MPLRRRRKGRGLEISLCDFNNIGENQTREVASHAGLGEEHFQKNSSCKVFGSGRNGICLRKSKASVVNNSAPVGKIVEENDRERKRGGSQGPYHWNLFSWQ